MHRYFHAFIVGSIATLVLIIPALPAMAASTPPTNTPSAVKPPQSAQQQHAFITSQKNHIQLEQLAEAMSAVAPAFLAELPPARQAYSTDESRLQYLLLLSAGHTAKAITTGVTALDSIHAAGATATNPELTAAIQAITARYFTSIFSLEVAEVKKNISQLAQSNDPLLRSKASLFLEKFYAWRTILRSYKAAAERHAL